MIAGCIAFLVNRNHTNWSHLSIIQVKLGSSLLVSVSFGKESIFRLTCNAFSYLLLSGGNYVSHLDMRRNYGHQE
ncbi:putative UDP-glucuronosyltransferase 2B20 [Daphnia magna]|uniref:Putative UDP-glucuronosyltransferase 2B20 n=1 Tax=Daphnia magna TaxID=35525 RepID=A0A164EBM2_9CRUS|nr:putative UDP-glucuronosyltransferase 2B20 [Daphnia magna]